jgi:hypothetical protein
VGDYTPVFTNGSYPFTSQASGTITGGDCVVVSGSGTVAASGAAGVAVGVAAHDAVTGQKVTVWPLRCVHETIAGVAGVTAGNRLKVGATAGKLINDASPSVGVTIGDALTTAAQDAVLRWLGR